MNWLCHHPGEALLDAATVQLAEPHVSGNTCINENMCSVPCAAMRPSCHLLPHLEAADAFDHAPAAQTLLLMLFTVHESCCCSCWASANA